MVAKDQHFHYIFSLVMNDLLHTFCIFPTNYNEDYLLLPPVSLYFMYGILPTVLSLKSRVFPLHLTMRSILRHIP